MEIDAAVENSLNDEIQKYVASGYLLTSQTSRSAQLTKYKTFNWLVFILICIIGALFGAIFSLVSLLYLFDCLVNKVSNVVYLNVGTSENGKPEILITKGREKEKLPTWILIILLIFIFINLRK